MAPRTSPTFNPGGEHANYLQSLIDETWAYYADHTFELTRAGETLNGKVVNGQLKFTRNGAGSYVLNKPTSVEAFQCSGALASAGMNAIELRLGTDFCAAFHRGVAENTADWYRPAAYYTNNPKNDYAEFFHEISLDDRAYGFPYDDINDQSTVKILKNVDPPSLLTVTVDW